MSSGSSVSRLPLELNFSCVVCSSSSSKSSSSVSKASVLLFTTVDFCFDTLSSVGGDDACSTSNLAAGTASSPTAASVGRDCVWAFETSFSSSSLTIASSRSSLCESLFRYFSIWSSCSLIGAFLSSCRG
ncbi:hypothetical protein NIES4075_62700 [Tolypothrix sp. NIES-4075]|nr:hypothetical protein NIES4075_62700 [Tolypothrix sp. NIES-4075]